MTDMKDDHPEEEETPSLGLFGYNLPQTILLVMLAGFLYQAYTDRDQVADLIDRWVFGIIPPEPISPSQLSTIELSNSIVVEKSSIDVGSFQFSKPEHWLTVQAPDFRYLQFQHPDYMDLFSPLLKRMIPNVSPFLTSPPKVYAISLPGKGGQIFALNQRITIMTPALLKLISKAIRARKEINSTGFQLDPDLMLPGEIELGHINPDEAFNIALSDQIYYMKRATELVKRPEIRRISRRNYGDYAIAEIDYTTGENRKISTIIYWHHKEGAAIGELGIFFANLKNNSQHEDAVRSVFSSLRIGQGKESVWQNLNYDGQQDKDVMPFIRIEINQHYLRQYDLNVPDIREKIRQSLPVEIDKLEDVEVALSEKNLVRLGDIAIVSRLYGKSQTLQDFNSVMLFVSP
ncbi:MAG: hypothetical protein QM488_20420 [Rhizobiaceae bacterium]